MKNLAVWIAVFSPLVMHAQISFSPATGLTSPAEHFSGSVMGISDMDGDGLDDIVRLDQSKNLSIQYQSAPGRPFRSRDFGAVSGVEQWSLSIGDINQDGFNDMVFAANENPGTVFYSRKSGDSIVYDKQFLAESEKAYAQACNLVDINGDGWLDFFLCNDLGENRIWANNGSGRLDGSPVAWIDFTTVPASDKSGNYGSVWTDIDNDGDLDLYIAKCKAGVDDPKDPRRVNALYVNKGNGTFFENASAAGLASGHQSWAVVAGDCDLDGDQDLFIINHYAPCQLMINNGFGIFTEATGTGIQYDGAGVQAAWVDFDNDGMLDLLIAGSKHQLYLNRGNHQFEAAPAQVFGPQQIESFVVGDLNHDGRMDIYAGYGLVFNKPSHRPDALWLNTSPHANHYLKVRLEGLMPNKSAVGARISLHSGNYKIAREIHSGVSYGTSQSLTMHFGLGSRTKVDSLVIRWPDKYREVIQEPFIDRILIVKQKACFAFDPDLKGGNLCTTGDSIVITAPVNGNYEWSGGEKTRSLTVRKAGEYQLAMTTLEGCRIFSNRLYIGSGPIGEHRIQASDTVICAGTSASLRLETNLSVLWNTGDTSKTIQVSAPGPYFGRVSESCVPVQSDTVRLRTIIPSEVIGRNDTIGPFAKATLRAEGESIVWYAEPSGGSPLAFGNTYFIQTPLDKTTTFYAQSVLTLPGAKFNVGLKEHSGTTKFHANNFSGRLLFDVKQASVLKSVKVYADTPALRQIDLLNAAGEILASKLVRIEAGESRVILNFNLPPGDGYALAANEEVSIKQFGSRSPKLYRTEGEVGFPLKGGPVSIYATNAGAGNYYYFYDWELAYQDLVCASPRVPVRAVILTVATRDQAVQPFRIFPNPANRFLNIEWKGPVPSREVRFIFSSIDGQILLSASAHPSGPNWRIPLPQWDPGIYLLRVKSGENEFVSRFAVIN
ncbi:MAG TPA: FG-GAP-like repeat-containing protein [Saprospiraceae bacterium]|nr:FG-GAP-like repeat-containing protein [Saprospiraceae bacterium]